ncbi:hypothetical protein sync_0851 [Synechococcus sp. CC9311]|nr:hypothetical protein sync_0851 [Synechococcus sp. CC9311]
MRVVRGQLCQLFPQWNRVFESLLSQAFQLSLAFGWSIGTWLFALIDSHHDNSY